MSWMMDKALQAQEAQKAVETQAVTETGGMADGATTVRLKGKGKGSEHPVKIVPTTNMRYASDLKHRGQHSGNGVESEEVGPVASQSLPRKRRGKK